MAQNIYLAVCRWRSSRAAWRSRSVPCATGEPLLSPQPSALCSLCRSHNRGNTICRLHKRKQQTLANSGSARVHDGLEEEEADNNCADQDALNLLEQVLVIGHTLLGGLVAQTRWFLLSSLFRPSSTRVPFCGACPRSSCPSCLRRRWRSSWRGVRRASDHRCRETSPPPSRRLLAQGPSLRSERSLDRTRVKTKRRWPGRCAASPWSTARRSRSWTS